MQEVNFNYNGTHLIVLMAVWMSSTFSVIDVGSHGQRSHGRTWAACNIEEVFKCNSFLLPQPEIRPKSLVALLHVFVANAAFLMGENLLEFYRASDRGDLSHVQRQSSALANPKSRLECFWNVGELLENFHKYNWNAASTGYSSHSSLYCAASAFWLNDFKKRKKNSHARTLGDNKLADDFIQQSNSREQYGTILTEALVKIEISGVIRFCDRFFMICDSLCRIVSLSVDNT